MGAATALAAAPAAAGFLLLPKIKDGWAPAGLFAAWLIAAVGLAAGAGGANSPLVALFAVAPVLSRALGGRAVVEAGAAAALGCGLAEVLAEAFPSHEVLGPMPLILGLAAALFIAALLSAPAPQTIAREDMVARRVAEVSHELRTPLTHILGFAEMIERELFGPVAARYVEYAGLIRASGAHLLQIVNDLLDLSKMDAGRYDLEFERFDVRAIVDEVVRMSTDSARKKSIVLSARAPDAPLIVRGDSRAIRRMLLNTVSNAVKFTPEGGRIAVEARASGRRLLLDTIDTGPGIPEAERKRLGQPYERGASGGSAEGTGLGLALVRGLAELHGGGLSFHDAPGGGALVRIEAPIVAI